MFTYVNRLLSVIVGLRAHRAVQEGGETKQLIVINVSFHVSHKDTILSSHRAHHTQIQGQGVQEEECQTI